LVELATRNAGLLGALHSEPVARLIRNGESERVTAALRDLARPVTGQ
jgi:hypothetical protein